MSVGIQVPPSYVFQRTVVNVNWVMVIRRTQIRAAGLNYGCAHRDSVPFGTLLSQVLHLE